MRITPDQIIDRLNLKRQANYWRAIAALLLLLLIVMTFDDQNLSKLPVPEHNYVARIQISGVISQDLARINNLAALAKDSAVKAVIVHVNSPGGTVVGGQSLYMALKKISLSKPVAVVMGDVAASAAYMTSLGADYIVAHEGSLTGSIGVIAESFEVTELAERFGVKFHHFKSSPLKGGPTPTEILSSEMKEAMDIVIQDTYQMFVEMVEKGRKLSRQEVLKIADGRVYTGRQALQLKLIDAVGNEDTALQWLCNKSQLATDIKVLDYKIEPYESRLDQILNTFSNVSILMKSIFTSNILK